MWTIKFIGRLDISPFCLCCRHLDSTMSASKDHFPIHAGIYISIHGIETQNLDRKANREYWGWTTDYQFGIRTNEIANFRQKYAHPKRPSRSLFWLSALHLQSYWYFPQTAHTYHSPHQSLQEQLSSRSANTYKCTLLTLSCSASDETNSNALQKGSHYWLLKQAWWSCESAEITNLYYTIIFHELCCQEISATWLA